MPDELIKLLSNLNVDLKIISIYIIEKGGADMAEKNDEKKARIKSNTVAFELTDEAQAKANELFDNMAAKLKARIPANPALAFVKLNINRIDELNRDGMTLAQIFEHLNKGLKLGISPSSFVQYVRTIRKEIGSDLYVSRKQRQSSSIANLKLEKAEAEAAPSARAMEAAAPSTDQAGNGWKCPECPEAKPDTYKGIPYYECRVCGTAYAADESGNITQTPFTAR